MKLNLSTAAIARTSARHPWRAIGTWLIMLGIAIALISMLLGSALTTDATGTLTNNFAKVTYNGTTGWAHIDYLS